jgi:hypothetical protein
MNDELDTTIYTENEVRVSVSDWDDGGAWLRLSANQGSMHTSLTRDEAQRLLAGLQAILAREVPV